MTRTDRVYRLRVFGDDADAEPLLQVTSLPEGHHAPGTRPSHPYLAEAPDVDGATLDPLTGAVTRGAATVRVIDAMVRAADPLVVLGGDDFAGYRDSDALRAVWTPPPDRALHLWHASPGTSTSAASEAAVLSLSDGAGAEEPTGAGQSYLRPDRVIARVFTGLPPATPVEVSARVCLDYSIGHDAQRSQTDIVLRVRDAASSALVGETRVSDRTLLTRRDAARSPAGRWVALRAQGATDATGALRVECGVANVTVATVIHERQVFLDDVRIVRTRTLAADDRVVTRVLADSAGRPQLLNRRAILDEARLADCTYEPGTGWRFPTDPARVTVLQAGALTRLTLPRPLVWELTVGDDPRDARETRVFARLDAELEPASAVSRGMARWIGTGTPSCVVGGPVLGPWPGGEAPAATLRQRWRLRVVSHFAEGIGLDAVYTPPPPAIKSGRLSGVDQERERMRVADVARPWFVPFTQDVASDPLYALWASRGIAGWFPRLRCEVRAADGAPGGPGNGAVLDTRIPLAAREWYRGEREGEQVAQHFYRVVSDLTFMAGTWEFPGRPSMHLHWPLADVAAGRAAPRPAIGTEVDVVVYALDATPATPYLVAGHVADLLAAGWRQLGLAYDGEALTALRERYPWLRAALRVTEPPTLEAFERDWIGGPFGVAITRDGQGRRVAQAVRMRPLAPAGTITAADLATADPPAFTLDAGSAITGVTYEFARFRPWTREDGERPADGLVSVPLRVEGTSPTTGPLAPIEGTPPREQTYRLPGAPLVAAGWTPADPIAFADAMAVPLLARRGRGGVFAELDVLPSGDYPVGAEVLVEVPHKPGADPAQQPVAQRGTARPMQVLRRSPRPWGAALQLEEVATFTVAPAAAPPPAGRPAVPAAVLGVVRDPAAPTTHLRVTLTNAAAFGPGGWRTVLATVLSATEPTGEETTTFHGGHFDYGADAPTRVLGPFPVGATVWVQAATVDARDQQTDPPVRSAWTRVTLTPVTDHGLPPQLSAAIDEPDGALRVAVSHQRAIRYRLATSSAGPVTRAAVRAAPLTAAAAPPAATGGASGGAGGESGGAPPVRRFPGDDTYVSMPTVRLGAPVWIGVLGYDADGNETPLADAQLLRRVEVRAGDNVTQTIDEATGAITLSAVEGAAAVAFADLPDGASITWATEGARVRHARVTLAGNRTLEITGAIPGATGVLIVTQDAVGGRTLTLPASSRREGGALALSSAPGAVDVLAWLFDGAQFYWTLGKGFA